MKWEKGRQGTGYEKLKIFSFASSFLVKGIDCYLIRYFKSDFIPTHTDKVESGTHHRLNIILKKPRSGGEFICKEASSFFDRVYYFRPDIMEHSVTECSDTRIVLSLGWVL